MALGGLCGVDWGPFGGLLGSPGQPLGSLGVAWAALGDLCGVDLGPFGSLLGSPGPPLGSLGVAWAALGGRVGQGGGAQKPNKSEFY